MDHLVLKRIAEVLNEDSCNYTVFLQAIEVLLPVPTEKEAIIKMALGDKATVGGFEEVQNTSVWPVVENALFYTGDSGSGPSTAIIKSEKLANLLGLLKCQVTELNSLATITESFWLRDGHPAYPVFWDFAFLFTRKASATILIGSSSN